MTSEVLYVVNNDSTTSIPLEVVAQIKEMYQNIKTVVYYKDSDYPVNLFIRDLIYIDANSFLDSKALGRVKHLLKKTNPDIIHTHHTISALVFFVLGRIICPSAKLIKTVHTSNNSFRWDQKFLNFFIYLLADKIICNSETTLKSFSSLEKYITRNKTEVVYNGVSQSRIINAKSSKESGNLFQKKKSECIVGSVGRLIKVKDYKTLIKAFDKLYQNSEKDIRLLLIGDGQERKHLERLSSDRGLERALVFTGGIERQQVYSLLKQIDIFVITSLHEGFCNTLVEAMAAEKAVVCSSIPTLREVAGDAVLYAEAGNPESFSQAINKLLNDEDLFHQMKEKAGKRAKKFTLETCAKNYIKEYI